MINVNKGVITGAASFKSLHDTCIPSRPLPLLKFNDWIKLYISLLLISCVSWFSSMKWESESCSTCVPLHYIVFMPDLKVFCSMHFGQEKIIIFIYNITCKLTCKVINFKDVSRSTLKEIKYFLRTPTTIKGISRWLLKFKTFAG